MRNGFLFPEEVPGGEGRGDGGGSGEDEQPRPEAAGRLDRFDGRLARRARKRFEVEREVVGRVEALLGILLEAVAHDALEAGRDVLVGDGEIRRILLQDRRHRVRGGVAVESASAREHLVQDGAEGENVRARVGRPAAHLLGRHIAERAHDDAGLGARGGRGQVRLRPRSFADLGELGQAEVEDLDAPVLRDEEVLGLQVPVDDPLLVRGGEAVRDLHRIVDRLARRKPATREHRAQRLALEQLLDDVRGVVASVRSDVVDRGDVRVIEHARGFRLLLEAAQAVRILREGGGQHLDRDLAPEARVLGAVHLAHSPGADLAEDFVGTELRAGGEGHCADSTRGRSAAVPGPAAPSAFRVHEGIPRAQGRKPAEVPIGAP